MGESTAARCEQCGAALPAGAGPRCDLCVLGITEEPAKSAPGVSPYRSDAPEAQRGAAPGAISRSGPPPPAPIYGPGGIERRKRPRHAKHQRPAPLGTWAVLMVNLALYGAMWVRGGMEFDQSTLVHWGAKDNELLWQGQLWRLVSPMFVHLNLWHLGFNSLILWLFGPQLELLVGTPRFVALYVLAGMCGVLTGFAYHDKTSAGASGAIFGVFGAIFSFLVINRTAIRHMRTRDLVGYTLTIVLLAMVGLFSRQIDNWAHFGGLVGGVLGGLVLVPRLPGLVPRPMLRWAGGLLLVALMVLWLWQGYVWMSAYNQGMTAFLRGDLPEAARIFKRAATLRRKPTPALTALARIEARQGRSAEAIKAALALKEAEPEDAQARQCLAELYRDTGRHADALKEFEELHELEPRNATVYRELGRAYIEQNDAKKAAELLAQLPDHVFERDPIMEYYLGDALRRTGQIERGTRYLSRYEDRLRRHVKREETSQSLNNLAWYLFEEGRSLDEALKLATKAVDKDPQSPYYLGTLGCVYFQLGRYKEAMDRFEKALDRHVSRADAGTDFYFAAMTAAKVGQKDVAQKYLKLAEEADPRSRYLSAARRTVAAP